MKKMLLAIIILSANSAFAQINGQDTVYSGTPATFTSGISGQAYTWIQDTVQINLSPSLPGTTTFSGSPLTEINFMSLTNDSGNWYALLTNYDNANNVVRLKFGNSLDNTPISDGLISGVGADDRAEGVAVVKQGIDYYGFVVNGSKIIRLDFGNSMANTPVLSTIINGFPSPASGLSWGHQLNIKKVGTQYIGFIADRNGYLWRMEFGADITNTPTLHKVSPSGGSYQDVTDFALYQQNGNWYMLLTNLSINSGVSRLDFGTSLTNNTPSITYFGNPNDEFFLTRSIAIISDCNELYALVSNEDGQLFKLNFHGDITSTPDIDSAGQLTPSDGNNGFNAYIADHKIKLFALNWEGNLIRRINLADLPSSSATYYATDSFTTTFNTPGVYHLTLYVDQGGLMGPAAFCKTVVVTQKKGEGIADLSSEGKDIVIAPNPARNFLRIERTDAHQAIAFYFYDALGRQLLTQKIQKNQKQLIVNLNSFATGIYHYRMVNIKNETIKSGEILKD